MVSTDNRRVEKINHISATPVDLVLSGKELGKALSEGLGKLALTLTTEQQQKLLLYLTLIVKWNKVYNLSAADTEEKLLLEHLLDSIAIIKPLAKWIQQQQAINSYPGIKLLDVGCGAGFPGVVIAICLSEISVCCVDAVGKKTSFIQQVISTLGLNNLKSIHSRVETLDQNVVGKGFDLIICRAFTDLSEFIKLTAAHLKPTNGVWVAMKAKNVGEELSNLPEKYKSTFHVEPIKVPFLHQERHLVWIQNK